MPRLLPVEHDRDAMKERTRGTELAEIFRDHHDFVWRSVRRLGLGPAAVDDAVQDVFLVVHRRLGDFEGRSSLRTWLFGIAMRVVKDHRRREMRLRRREEAAPAPLPGRGPEDLLAHSESVARLDRALAVLDPNQRRVFELAELEQMTAPEIAQALGVKLNTVYSRLRLARRRVERELLGDAAALPVACAA
jgi:RNA polymerase sigma-70 factor (ECF subfamily)